ncbi:MAG: LysR substrate-binding domain-containing protein [Pseudomonadota bacterium]|nr:LysR substrate-binding domain-containing protein [Pseudomonadota bacterium]
MNIKYRQLKAFSIAARTLSFTQAADELAVTQASFSAMIRQLEADLGVPLFERTTRRCSLTDAGVELDGKLRGPLGQLEQAYRDIQDVGSGKRGKIVLCALPSMASTYVTEVLARFRATYPGVDLVLMERKNEEVFASVKRRECELGFGSFIRPEPELEWTPIVNDRLNLIVPIGHPLDQDSVTWTDLGRFPQIRISTGSAERAMLESRLHLEPDFEVEYVATAVSMVRRGLGVTTLPSSVQATLNLEGVSSVPIEGDLAVRQLGVARRNDVDLGPAASTFYKLVQQIFADREQQFASC